MREEKYTLQEILNAVTASLENSPLWMVNGYDLRYDSIMRLVMAKQIKGFLETGKIDWILERKKK